MIVAMVRFGIIFFHCFCCSLLDHGKLFQVVYEKDTIQRGEIEAHIWSYRPRISLKHLVQSMQREKTATEDLSALKEFLKEVTNNNNYSFVLYPH